MLNHSTPLLLLKLIELSQVYCRLPDAEPLKAAIDVEADRFESDVLYNFCQVDSQMLNHSTPLLMLKLIDLNFLVSILRKEFS